MEIANDEFWLKYAKENIGQSFSSKNEAADKLQTMVSWFWTLYTTSFIVASTIPALDIPPLVAGLMAALPSFSLSFLIGFV